MNFLTREARLIGFVGREGKRLREVMRDGAIGE